MLAGVLNLLLAGSFVESLREEAPDLFATFVPPPGMPLEWRRRARARYWKMILFRGYRRELAAYPRSRAWASWLFLAQWLQAASALAFLLLALAAA